jgi:glycerol-3-phosphate O-acyltransferase
MEKQTPEERPSATEAHDYYGCFLPSDIGFLPSWVLRLFYSGVKLTREQLAVTARIPDDAIVIYVTKFKSNFAYLFAYTAAKRHGLSVPELAIGCRIMLWQPLRRGMKIFTTTCRSLLRSFSLPDPYAEGFYHRELLNGRSAFMTLVEKKGFYRRFVKSAADPIRHLIDIQQTTTRPIYLVPHLIFFGKNPERAVPSLIDVLFGSEQKPGRIRRLVRLFRKPGTVFAEISEPVNLQRYLQDDNRKHRNAEHQALLLRRDLLRQVNRHRQSITGPVRKSPEEIKESILTGERLREFMAQHSQKRDIPLTEVRKKADGYLEEIAAKHSAWLVKFFASTLGSIIKAMFDGYTVNYEMLTRLKKMALRGPVIVLPCHKSHIDYLMISYVLYHNNMAVPLIAAGKNLSFWPLGPIFRYAGAFFLRRTFRGAILYAIVFKEYIHKMLAEGFNIEFFLEGTRSRTGKLLMPKLGLLSILLNAYCNDACEDLIFAPVFIGYDRVLEERAYLNEIEGGQKEPESLSQVIKARKFLKKRYGKIYIQFHEPISLNELQQQQNLSLKTMPAKEINVFTRNLGFGLLKAIDRVTVVTPYALMASALLNCSQQWFTYEHLKTHLDDYLALLAFQKARLADTLFHNPEVAFDYVFEAYRQRKLIEPLDKDSEGSLSNGRYQVNPARRPLLDYYKNNCIGFFVPCAFTALEILNREAFQFSSGDLHAGYDTLQDLFQNEFTYEHDLPTDFKVRKNIKAFIDDALLVPHPTLPDTYNLTAVGLRKLKFLARFVKTFLESYWIVLRYFIETPAEDAGDKDRLKKIQSIGSRMLKRKEVHRNEAVSRINFTNAADYFTSHGIKSSEDEEAIQRYARIIQRYLNCLQL